MSPNKNVEKYHLCKICNKKITGSSYKFRAHLYRHRAVEARFKCSFCSKEFFRHDSFVGHMRSHEGERTSKPKYICDHCDRGFVNKRNLIVHLKVHDDNTLYRFRCIACSATYCEERLLKYHIRKTHYNLKYNDSVHIKKETNDTWVERVKESEVCVEMTKVNDNVLTIKKYGQFELNKYDDVYGKTNLKTTKSDKKLTMEDPSEKLNEKKQFKEYISSVFAQKDKSQYSKAKCDYCQKEMLKKSLLSHIRERHLKIRRFKCDVCKVTFKRHYQLVDHDCGKKRRRCKTEQ